MTQQIKLLFVFLFFLSAGLHAQRGKVHHGHRHARHAGHGKAHRVVVHRSVYRPAKVVVFRPHWRPAFSYHRRWIFFPKYNLYWDNWRNHYVFRNGAVWVSQPTAPPVIVNVNLEKENHRELKEEEDDIDDIYRSNDSHNEPKD